MQELKRIKSLGVFIIGTLWMVFLCDAVLFRGALSQYGVHPRQLAGLKGVLLSPLFHGNLMHLINNTIGLVLLGSIVAFRGIFIFTSVSLISMVVSGLGIWLIGASGTNHIGYSGIIFGYLGYLLLTGIFDRKLGSILITLVSGLLYGEMIFGVLPVQAGVSWEGHFFGFLGGGLSAYLLSKRRSRPEAQLE